jgi:hypothetical protein
MRTPGHCIFRFVFRWLACCVISLATGTHALLAQAPQKYPIVFKDPKGLELFGISLVQPADGAQPPPILRHTCFQYGNEAPTVYLLSLSDAFLARYTKRGFTREGLCLALVSGARFDPETGKRLPTYVVRFEDKLRLALKGLNPKTLSKAQLDVLTEDGSITEELPLAVPHCFKNGTPYLDCQWRYGLKTGAKLSAVATRRHRSFGEAWDRQVRDAINSNKLEPKGTNSAPYLNISGYWGMTPLYPGQPSHVVVSEKDWRETSPGMTWTVVSPALPRGYGYALYATGELGPSISISAVRSALGEDNVVTQINAERLRQQLDED